MHPKSPDEATAQIMATRSTNGRFPAVFLDRDDTLILDTGYCSDPDDVQLLPGAREGIGSLRAAGFKLVIVTNQSGIGRGFLTENDFWAVQARLETLLGPNQIDGTYFCPDTPDKATIRRKPAPGMLLEAARDLELDLGASFMIGDKELDVEAGINAGVRAAIRITSTVKTCQSSNRKDVWLAPDIEQAVRTILRLATAGLPG